MEPMMKTSTDTMSDLPERIVKYCFGKFELARSQFRVVMSSEKRY